jgi:hypothetical protein
MQVKRADRPKEGKIVKGNELVDAREMQRVECSMMSILLSLSTIPEIHLHREG